MGRSHHSRAAAGPLVAGLLTMAVLLGLWGPLPHDAFFSGDAGIKLLQTESLIASGYHDVTLPYRGLDVDPDSRISPFRLEPSLYIEDGRNYAVFPVAFSFLSTFGYRSAGMAGLSLLPLLAAAFCLVATYRLARLFVPPAAASVAMVGTMLATPLGFYALTFWEHLPAVALVLAALWLFLGGATRAWRPLVAGLLLGLAVWLRTEVALLTAILAATGLAMLRRPRDVLLLGTGAAAAFVALLLFNRAVYGDWLRHVGLNLSVAGPRAGDDPITTRLSWLRRAWFGLNLPQTVPADRVSGPEVMRLIAEDTGRETLAGLGVALVVVGCVLIALVARRLSEWRRWLRLVPLAGALVLGAVTVTYLVAMRRDESPLLTVLASGGLLTFAPWLVLALVWPGCHVSAGRRDLAWLLVAALAFAVAMPLLAPNDGGIRWGPRYLLTVVPVLAIAAVAAVAGLAGWVRSRIPWIVAVALLVVAVAVNVRGYDIMRQKKCFNHEAEVAMLASGAPRVAMDQWWMLFNAATVLTGRTVHLVNTPNNLAELVARARRAGDTRLVYAMQGRDTRLPESAQRLGVVVERREEVRAARDGYFAIAVFTLRLDGAQP